MNGTSRSLSFVPLSAPGALTIARQSATEARLTWSPPSGCLQSAPAMSGPWSDVPGAISGNVITLSPGQQFFRVAQ